MSEMSNPRSDMLEEFFREYRWVISSDPAGAVYDFSTWLALKGYKIVNVDPDEFRKG